MKKIVMLISLLLVLIATPKGVAQTGDELFQKGLQLEEVKGELEKAIDVYKNIISVYAPNKQLVAKSLLHLGKCYEKLGKSEAQKAYERVVREFADQSELVAEARARLSVLAKAAAGDHVKSFTARQIWAGPGVDFGSPSPDGRYLSFVDWETGDLALREIATGENRHVTKKGGWFQSGAFAESFVFSPDGNQIAYSWWTNDGKYELRVIRVDGSSVRVLYRNDDVGWIGVFDWSRDGKYIAATFEKDGANQIALVSPADSSVRIVKSLGSRPIVTMCFSPDGRYLAYTCPPRDTSRQRDIYVLSTDNSREISLVQHPADDVLFGWAPSGKTIFFGSDRAGSKDGWTLKVEEGKPVGDPVLVKRDIGRFTPMGFSQNGSFYYGVDTEMRDIYSVAIDSSGRVLSSPAKIAPRFVGSNFCPAWSSYGRYLAYISQRVPVQTGLGSGVLCILAMETGIERELTVNLDSPGYPRWSTDDRSIILTGMDRKVGIGLFQVDVQTGRMTPFSVGNDWQAAQAVFASDGSALYFTRYIDPHKGIVKRDLKTGQETQLTSGTSGGALALSPDDDYLVYWVSGKSVNTIMTVPTSGGTPREITQMNVLRYIDVSLAWTGDGRFLLFTKPNKDVTELWRVSIDGKQSESLGLAMKLLTHLNVRSDGKQLAFTGGESSQEIWVMENFLAKEDGEKK